MALLCSGLHICLLVVSQQETQIGIGTENRCWSLSIPLSVSAGAGNAHWLQINSIATCTSRVIRKRGSRQRGWSDPKHCFMQKHDNDLFVMSLTPLLRWERQKHAETSPATQDSLAQVSCIWCDMDEHHKCYQPSSSSVQMLNMILVDFK